VELHIVDFGRYEDKLCALRGEFRALLQSSQLNLSSTPSIEQLQERVVLVLGNPDQWGKSQQQGCTKGEKAEGPL
jgi:hypothetical protein